MEQEYLRHSSFTGLSIQVGLLQYWHRFRSLLTDLLI